MTRSLARGDTYVCWAQNVRIEQFLAEEPNLMHACKDVNMTITTESVTIVDMDNCDVRYDCDFDDNINSSTDTPRSVCHM